MSLNLISDKELTKKSGEKKEFVISYTFGATLVFGNKVVECFILNCAFLVHCMALLYCCLQLPQSCMVTM